MVPAKAEGSQCRDSGNGDNGRRHAALPAPSLPRFDTSVPGPIPASGISVWFGIANMRNYEISRNGLLEISASQQPGSACCLLCLYGLQGRDCSPYTENTVHICAAAQIITKLRVGAGPGCGGGAALALG